MGRMMNAVRRGCFGATIRKILIPSTPFASFSVNNSDLLAVLTAEVNALQSGSGDPSPNNVRPITGYSGVDIWRTGKNLVDLPRMCDGANISYNSNRLTASYNAGIITGIVQNNGSYTRDVTVTMATANQIVLPKDFGGYLTMSFSHNGMRPNSSNLLRAQLKYANNTTSFGNTPYNANRYVMSTGSLSWAAGRTISGLYLVATYNASASIGDEIKFLDLQVEYADSNPSASEYEAANIAKYNIAFPDGMVVYGGTVDVLNGILTVTHAALKLGSSTVFSASSSGQNRFYCDNVGNLRALSGLHGACSHYVYVGTKGTTSELTTDLTAGINANLLTVYIKDSRFSSASDLNAYLTAQETANAPVTIIYELNSPQTVQVDSNQIVSLIGKNNIWANTGNVTIGYWET